MLKESQVRREKDVIGKAASTPCASDPACLPSGSCATERKRNKSVEAPHPPPHSLLLLLLVRGHRPGGSESGPLPSRPGKSVTTRLGRPQRGCATAGNKAAAWAADETRGLRKQKDGANCQATDSSWSGIRHRASALDRRTHTHYPPAGRAQD